MSKTLKKIAIIGAGPAGLAAAYELTKNSKDFEITILETESQVGGIAKTLNYKGYRFDLGGHRFYSKFPEINKLYKTFLGQDMLLRERLSRIYYEKRFYDYPITANALFKLGFVKSSKIGASWLLRQLARYKNEKTFEEWVTNRFGDELFKIFFKSYTEKVWGISTSKLSADWAAQRIQNFSLARAALNAIFKVNTDDKTIIKKFYYPKFGPGMLYEKMAKIIQKKGAEIQFQREVFGFKKYKDRITHVQVKNKKSGKVYSVPTEIVISTTPLNKLALSLANSKKAKAKIRKLSFRSFITVNLIIKKNPFDDQWIYVHEPNVKVARIQNFRNWSPYMVKPNTQNTPIGMEYFASEGDKLWTMDDEKLIDLAKKELVQIGLCKAGEIFSGFVYRVKNAYPIYNFNYKEPLKLCQETVSKYVNLFPCGRGGLFRYNNQDHSILTGFYVARNILTNSKEFDVWKVNDNENYLESN